MITMRRALLVTVAFALILVAASPSGVFERVGDKKILVFAGRQEVRTTIRA